MHKIIQFVAAAGYKRVKRAVIFNMGSLRLTMMCLLS